MDCWVEQAQETSAIFVIPHILQRNWGNLSKYILDIGTFYPTELPLECRFKYLIPFCEFFMFHALFILLPHTGWSQLPLPVAMRYGTSASRLSTCVGCSKAFTSHAPAIHCCHFRRFGFLFQSGNSHSCPCGVMYHAGCVRAGAPFCTRLSKSKGLSLPHQVPVPHFIFKPAKFEPNWDESSTNQFLISVC
jgi:hypothetical protein